MASGVVVPDDYSVVDDGELSYIYSKEYRDILPDIKAYQKDLISTYEQEFGFELDDKLSVGLASNRNQIANGFSTQTPFNAQMFYASGVTYIDYFCFSSWLKTLLIHETAHNFQLNPKENFISKASHEIFGNSAVAFLGPLPLFPIPNLTESLFILEGNAVLNESRFGNGGRLFSGYAVAEVVTLAKAGEITPALMYNDTLAFPYGEKFYLVGGFFQQFLAERYGIERVNGYFKRYAQQPYPFFTNSVFEKNFGKSFEILLEEFVSEFKSRHKSFQKTEGTLVAKSQLLSILSEADGEITTLVGSNKSTPKLMIFTKKGKAISFEGNSWKRGEVFKYKGKYYTQSSAKTSPTKIEMGLFDSAGFIEEHSAGKVVQGFTKSGKMVYFDLASSLEAPQVYVEGTFITESHSSVHVDGEDLYYFKQEGEKRTLYKNREALFSYVGHYGFVTDVDKNGAIYFISSSLDGSTAYRFLNGLFSRVSLADDIIDLKLINDKEVLVNTIHSTGYELHRISLGNYGGEPYNQEVLSAIISKKIPMDSFSKKGEANVEEREYNAFSGLRYSNLNPSLTYDTYLGFGIDLSATFVDPLFQNQLSLFASHTKERDIAGLSYDSVAQRLEYGGSLFGVFKNDDYDNSDRRDLGYEIYGKLPLYRAGYWGANTTLAYSKPYDNIYREPLTLSLDIKNQKHYGYSKYTNSLNSLSLFATKDRENNLFGGSYTFKHDLFAQSYLGVKATYIKSDMVDGFEEHGIELKDGFSSLQAERATVDIPSFSYTTYAEELKVGEISLKKVFDGSAYFYSLPLSLQRESIYAKERIYDIDFNHATQQRYQESILGAELDLLFMHKLSVPLSLEWVHNSDVIDQDKFRVLFGGSF